MKRYNAALVIAETFYLDYAEMKDHQYKPGHYDKKVYTIGNDDYCACKIGEKPAKSIRAGTNDHDWVAIDSWFAEKIGWQVWEHKCQ